MTAPVVIVAPAALPSVDFSRLAECIREVENSPHRRGKNHERGPWQFTKAAWEEDANGLAFSLADDEDTARRVAIARLRRLAAFLRDRAIEATPYRLGLAWNGGISAVILNKWNNQGVKDYAVRVENTYLNR